MRKGFIKHGRDRISMEDTSLEGSVNQLGIVDSLRDDVTKGVKFQTRDIDNFQKCRRLGIKW